MVLYVNGNNVRNFDSYEVEHIPPKIKNSKGNKNIAASIYRIRVMCEYVCIGFIDFILKGKSLLGYTNLFCPNEYEKNNKIILKYFQ